MRTGGKPVFENAAQMAEAAAAYFEYVVQTPLYSEKLFAYQGGVTRAQEPHMRAMTIKGLCTFLGISESTWKSYRDRADYQELVTTIEQIIYTQKFEGAAAGLLNASIVSRDLGLAEQKQLTGKDGGPIEHDHTIIDLRQLTDEQLRAAEQLSEILTAPDGDSEGDNEA